VKSFQSLVGAENAAREFFTQLCWKDHRRFCVRCHGYRIYRIAGERYRCGLCKYTFHDFTGRWINNLRISCRNWLRILSLFESELSTRKISQQVDLSYPTVYKAVHVIRLAIAASSAGANDFFSGELYDVFLGAKRRGSPHKVTFNKIPVLGILEKNGIAKIKIVKGFSADSFLKLNVQMVRRGSIVYTEKFRNYDALIFCGYRNLNVDQPERFFDGEVYINGPGGFWSYVKERLIKYHGVSKEKFPLYLKEMEFRYNNRNTPIFIQLAKYLVNLVPVPLQSPNNKFRNPQ
jgi:transposase